jgi:hypothetical protein
MARLRETANELSIARLGGGNVAAQLDVIHGASQFFEITQI